VNPNVRFEAEADAEAIWDDFRNRLINTQIVERAQHGR
jgi:hypothetical protein